MGNELENSHLMEDRYFVAQTNNQKKKKQTIKAIHNIDEQRNSAVG